MKFPPFKLEEYFTVYEFSARYMMGSSDPETYALAELISMADKESLSLWENLTLGYTESYGLPLLREEISNLYTQINQENILVCAGAEEGIFIVLQALLKKNDQVVVITPCYQSLKEIPKLIGANITGLPLEWINNQWTFNLEKFSQLVADQTKLVILNFPHNPTGFHPSHKLFQEIIEIIRQHNCYLFCDEVYRLSEHNKQHTLPNAVDCYEKAISLGVMSKSFGLAGLRIGWLACNDKSLLKDFSANKNYTSICSSAPSEILTLIALRNKQYILDRNLAIAKKNLDLLDQFFSQFQSIYDWYRPTAGFIAFPRLTVDFPIEQFSKKLVDKESVLILPGSLFDNDNNHFRIGYGRKNLPEALDRFEKFTKLLI